MTLENSPDLVMSVAGEGPAALVLHGGGGPGSVAPISSHLAGSMRVLTPTLPGWDGSPRGDWMTGVDVFADVYTEYLEQQELEDVLVVGSSLGGWLAAEMAVRDHQRRIRGVVLVDAVGIEVPGEPMTDFFALSPREVSEHSFHDPDRFYVDPASIPREQGEKQRRNVETMRTVAGDPYMHDPGLRDQLGRVRSPVLLIWGEADRIVTPAYGRAYADSFTEARFELLREAGHLPQIERPAEAMALIDEFIVDIERKTDA